MFFLRCLRNLKKWSEGAKMRKNGEKMGKNGCPKVRIYTLLILFWTGYHRYMWCPKHETKIMTNP